MSMQPWPIWGPATFSGGIPHIIRVTPNNMSETIYTAMFNNLSNVPNELTVWLLPPGHRPSDELIVIGTPFRGIELKAGPSEPYVAACLNGIVLSSGFSVVIMTTHLLSTVASGWVNRSGTSEVYIPPRPPTSYQKPDSFSIVANPPISLKSI